MRNVEHVVHSQNELGEGPLWHGGEGRLYWVDIKGRTIESYSPGEEERRTISLRIAVTALGLRDGGGFVGATEAGFAFWDGVSRDLTFIGNPEDGRDGTRFNDGAVGPGGRFWAGSMYDGPETDNPPDGRLYSLDADRVVAMMQSGLTISNGLGWSPEADTMYLTDTLRRAIYAYDYDPEVGTIRNRRTLVRVPEGEGVPDGLTVDSDGCIWSARWGGWKVARYSPDGELMEEIGLPIECPTSCTFGGENLHQLYISSAWTALDDRARADQPLAGDLFRVDLRVRGMPEHRFLGRRRE